MAQQLSKADRIRKILHLTNAEIAKRIGCRVEYVRAVRQRTSAGGNPIPGPADTKWQSRPEYLVWNRERAKAYHQRAKRRAEARA